MQAPPSGVQRPGGEPEGQHHAGDGAGRCGAHDEHRGEPHPPALHRGERRQGDGEPEGERQPADGDVDHRAGGEQHARRPASGDRSVPSEGVEARRGDDAAGDRHGRRTEHGAEDREQDPVARECGDRRTTGCSRPPVRRARRARGAAAGPASRRPANAARRRPARARRRRCRKGVGRADRRDRIRTSRSHRNSVPSRG